MLNNNGRTVIPLTLVPSTSQPPMAEATEARPRPAPPAYHVLANPTGEVCTLNSKYCFFVSKEQLYSGSRFRMPDELLETYIRQLSESRRAPEVTIAWQGGERTLMRLDSYRRAVAVEKKYQKPGTTIQNPMQTNGTPLTDEWRAFFREHNFLIGLSLDGPPAMHDTYRKDKGGHPTAEKVARAARLLREQRVDFNIPTTVNAANANYPLDVYHFLRDVIGATFIQFIPIVERINADGRSGWGADDTPPSRRARVCGGAGGRLEQRSRPGKG